MSVQLLRMSWTQKKQKAPNNIFKSNDRPNFQIQVASGQLEEPLATPTLKFDIGDNTFAKHFVVMKKLTGPVTELHFMRNNCVVIDTTHDLIHFPHLKMQINNTSKMRAKPQVVLTDNALTMPPRTTKTVRAFVDHPSEWKTISTVTPLERFAETAYLLTSHSVTTTFDRKSAVRKTKTTETPYLIKRTTQIAAFSVVTPEQAKFYKPVDAAILSMSTESNPDLSTYLNEFLRKNKPEQQNKTISFPTTESSGKIEDQTPNQTQILKELYEFKEKEKLKPKDKTKSRIKFFERFHWTVTLLTEKEKKAFEDLLVDCQDVFARHRMDIGMKIEFKIKLTPKTTKMYTAKVYKCRST